MQGQYTHRGKSLFDRGANGVICGDDVRVISLSDMTLNVMGIDDHEMCNLRIGSFGGVIYIYPHRWGT